MTFNMIYLLPHVYLYQLARDHLAYENEIKCVKRKIWNNFLYVIFPFISWLLQHRFYVCNDGSKKMTPNDYHNQPSATQITFLGTQFLGGCRQKRFTSYIHVICKIKYVLIIISQRSSD